MDKCKDIEEIPVNIFLKTGEIYPLSFIIYETDNYLNIVSTTTEGMEKICILNKECISSIEMCYLNDILFEPKEEKKDSMFY